MSFSPILLFHILGGVLGLLSGAAAMVFRKGSSGHRMAGNVFVISMLGLAASGVYMAWVKSQPGNILGGTLTFYLVTTAWVTGRRREGALGVLDWGAFLVALAIGGAAVIYGSEAVLSPTGLKYGFPAGPYFFLGSVGLLAAGGDLRMLVRGGIAGAQRLGRHLWRMCFALFIASSSVFLARQHLFPVVLRKTGVLLLLSVLPLILMVFWLIRVRLRNPERKKLVARGSHARSFRPQVGSNPHRNMRAS